jgi:hypothetical protein
LVAFSLDKWHSGFVPAKRKRVTVPKLKMGSDGEPFIDFGDLPTAEHELRLAFRMYRAPKGRTWALPGDEGRSKHGFTFDRVWRLLVLVRAGNGLAQAAAAVGLNLPGVLYWQKRGQDPQEPVGSPYRLFQTIFDVFSARVEVDLVNKIHRAALNPTNPDGVETAKWILTHRQGMKDRWAGKSETDVTSGGKPLGGRKLQEIKVTIVDKTTATQDPEAPGALNFSEEKAEQDAEEGRTIFDA